MDEDEGPHEDLNEHEMSDEASDSDEGQQEFDESSDEVGVDEVRGGGSHIKWGGMLVVSLGGVNFAFWSPLRCFGQKAIICSREGLL